MGMFCSFLSPSSNRPAPPHDLDSTYLPYGLMASGLRGITMDHYFYISAEFLVTSGHHGDKRSYGTDPTW